MTKENEYLFTMVAEPLDSEVPVPQTPERGTGNAQDGPRQGSPGAFSRIIHLEQHVQQLVDELNNFGTQVNTKIDTLNQNMGNAMGIKDEIMGLKGGIEKVIQAAQLEFQRVAQDREQGLQHLANQVRGEFETYHQDLLAMKGDAMSLFGDVHTEFDKQRTNIQEMQTVITRQQAAIDNLHRNQGFPQGGGGDHRQQQQHQQAYIGQQPDRPRTISINPRFDKIPVLEGNRQDYKDWRAKVVEHIASGRQDVRKTFQWAENCQTQEITEYMEKTAPDQNTLDVVELSEALYGVLVKLTGSYWATKRELVPIGRGFEMWRVISQDMEPKSEEWQSANATKVLEPSRAASLMELDRALDTWLVQIGRSGLEIPDWGKTIGLRKLVPVDVLDSLTRSTTLVTFQDQLRYVRALIRDKHAVQEAMSVSSKTTTSADNNKMDVGAVQQGCRHQAKEGEENCGKSDGVSDSGSSRERLMEEIFSFVSNRLGGKGGKPGGKGEGKGAGRFQGECHYCGKVGHRKSECRKLTADMQKGKAGGKSNDGKGGGKGQNGKGFGGKGYNQWGGYSGKWVNALGEEFTWHPDEETAGMESGDLTWQMCPVMATRPVVGKPPGLPVSTHNPFSVLELEEDEEDQRSQGAHERHLRELQQKRTINQKVYKPKPKMRPVIDKKKWQRMNDCCSGNLCAVLTTSPPYEQKQVVSAVQRRAPSYRKVDCLVDSGAADSVANPGDFPESPVQESPGSKEGMCYYLADGSPVPNEGQQQVRAVTEEGIDIGTTFQSCKVSRPILSVSRMSEQGNEVHFEKEGGTIRNKATGRVTRFHRKGGVYVLTLWVRTNRQGGNDPHFHRQGA